MMKAGGEEEAGREKERNRISGVHIKAGRIVRQLSGGKVGGRNGRAWTEFRIYFPFCMLASLPAYFFLYFRSIYISGTTGLFAFHLSNVALWPRITRDHDAGSFMKSSPSYGPRKWF